MNVFYLIPIRADCTQTYESQRIKIELYKTVCKHATQKKMSKCATTCKQNTKPNANVDGLLVFHFMHESLLHILKYFFQLCFCSCYLRHVNGEHTRRYCLLYTQICIRISIELNFPCWIWSKYFLHFKSVVAVLLRKSRVSNYQYFWIGCGIQHWLRRISLFFSKNQLKLVELSSNGAIWSTMCAVHCQFVWRIFLAFF